MKYHEQCPHCTHLVTAYTLPFNTGMADAFIKFAEKYYDGNGKGIKKGNIGITNTQYSNFQNLRHFGIISQSEKQEWHLTALGAHFYNADIGIVTPAGHMGGKTLPDDHLAWKTHSGKRTVLYINQFMPIGYKQRSDFKLEKNTLFEL